MSAGVDGPGRRPNVLLVISDQERQRDWLPDSVSLPARQRLLDEGLELSSFWTHAAPCSPSRATLVTGQYVPQHGVPDNIIHANHSPLDPAIPTIGRILAEHGGYRSSFIGKWHLSYGPHPDMEAHGYQDWEGNDQHFMGWAGTGRHFDPIIAEQAAGWLRANGTGLDRPWFLTVGLVNPHDVMWFPIDQPGYQADNERDVRFIKKLLASAEWKEGDPIPTFDDDYPEVVERLPANFDDDLHTKPGAHRQWRWDQQHGAWGRIETDDEKAWLRQLDYYVRLHELGDRSLGTILDGLDASGAADDTVVLFTSDHGDMCGSHGLRSKGPFVYDEIMRVPLYVRAPGVTTPGGRTDALASSVDLAPTIAAIAGLDPADHPNLAGVDLGPVLADPTASVRDQVLFAHDSAHTMNLRATRYAVRGTFDGRYKYARYYGVGGGKPNDDLHGLPSQKLYDVDAAFDDHDHELYDLDDDPHELLNLAVDRGRRHEVRQHFAELLALEATHFAPLPRGSRNS
ncbi:sulfatase [soil metagenome]